MQRPTCTDVRIRSIADAQVVFFAVSKGILPIVSRRLDSEERRCIRSGSVYVWEERGPDAEATGLGIERWTDGIRWGPSRVKDEFLFYNEKELDVELDVIVHPSVLSVFRPPCLPVDQCRTIPATRYSMHIPPGSFYGRPRERLVKQTYSVFVDTGRGRRKWHLIAYFTQETIDSLYTIDDYPDLARLRVPPGRFRSARGPKKGSRESPQDQNIGQSPSSSQGSYSPTYTPYPMAVPRPPSPLDPPVWPRLQTWPVGSVANQSRFGHTPEGAQILAPLAFLETTHIPRRHPIDDRALRSFTVS
ncbi:hypothetical protein BV25DRAFT_1797199 [Artomyces pyxidatus]|uniref:Uncharacterized protein n=1 Tax=Artomyces pyxidatus TaxID=48021 RepID=A0ACB8TBT6_9AGAM|nr:hypothetical protein BV25DRAFT_1797199 [Artomyces pyxidatus]